MLTDVQINKFVGLTGHCRLYSAWQRRSSLHERRDSLSLRDVREESQRLQEMMALGVSTEEEDEDDKMEPPVTVVLSLFPCLFNQSIFS